jgi:hypothetical protein
MRREDRLRRLARELRPFAPESFEQLPAPAPRHAGASPKISPQEIALNRQAVSPSSSHDRAPFRRWHGHPMDGTSPS